MLLNLPERLEAPQLQPAKMLSEKYLTRKDQKLWTASFEFEICSPNFLVRLNKGGVVNELFGTELLYLTVL